MAYNRRLSSRLYLREPVNRSHSRTVSDQRCQRHFASGVTRTYDWRVDQLDRLARMFAENEANLQAAMAADFKTASQEQIFETQACLGEIMFQKNQLREWMTPVEMPVPKPLAATEHKALVYRDPYGVALLIGPFNGPLLLLFRPAAAVLAAGNCCVLKLRERLMATSDLLTKLIPAYFEPEAVIALRGGRPDWRRWCWATCRHRACWEDEGPPWGAS